ncbi:MAG: Flp family type IVb pilin [Acidimicrobiales bacterium]
MNDDLMPPATETVPSTQCVDRRECRRGERGANLVEYALLVAMIAIVCVGAVRALGGTTTEPYSVIESSIGG